MTGYQKFGLVVGQVLIGLLSGCAGAIIASVVMYLYTGIIQMRLDLFGEFTYAIIGCYIGVQVGIGYDGYKFLKDNNIKNRFLPFFIQSFAGLTVGLLIIVLAIIPYGRNLPNMLTNFLVVALPLVGAIIGFDFQLLIKRER